MTKKHENLKERSEIETSPRIKEHPKRTKKKRSSKAGSAKKIFVSAGLQASQMLGESKKCIKEKQSLTRSLGVKNSSAATGAYVKRLSKKK